MIYICLAICILNTALWLYTIRGHRKPLPMTREDERVEQERKAREEKLNEVFDYDPYGKE